MSEESTPQPSPPRRHRPRLSELSRETTEGDLWELDADPVAKAPEEPAEEPSPEPPPEPLREAEPADAPGVAESVPTGRRPGEGEAGLPDEEVSDLGPAAPEPLPERVEETAPASRTKPASGIDDDVAAAKPASGTSAAAGSTPPARASLPRPSRRELISLGLVGVVFLGLAVWWVVGQFADIPTSRLGDDQPDLPVAGQHAEVAAAETYWRVPVRRGEQRDVAGSEVAFIPVISIELAGGSGALRAIYRNEAGSFVGDSITQPFENGRFVRSGAPNIEFPATAGYNSDAEYNGYRVGEARWTVEILEGPAAGAPGSSFRRLFIAPISPERR